MNGETDVRERENIQRDARIKTLLEVLKIADHETMYAECADFMSQEDKGHGNCARKMADQIIALLKKEGQEVPDERII